MALKDLYAAPTLPASMANMSPTRLGALAQMAGEPKSDARNNALLLERLAGEPNRHARFYCALALVRHADDPQPIIACGEWHGEILEAARGQGGFGYDPLFLVPDLDQTAAEIDHSLKNVLSHRGNAMRQLLDRLRAEQQA